MHTDILVPRNAKLLHFFFFEVKNLIKTSASTLDQLLLNCHYVKWSESH